MSASPNAPAVYIDTPLENIQKTTIGSIRNIESQSPRYGVSIGISQTTGDAWYLNAVGQSAKPILVAFTSEDHARALMKLLRPKQAITNRSLKVLKSQPIDCSEPASDDDLAGPDRASMKNHTSIQTTLQSTSLLAVEESFRTLRPKETHLSSTSQININEKSLEPSLNVGVKQHAQRALGTVASAIEGIDVSECDERSNRKTHLEIRQLPVNSEHSVVDATTIDSAAGSTQHEGLTSNGVDDSAQQVEAPKKQDQEYDSAYDISPRISKSKIPSRGTSDGIPAPLTELSKSQEKVQRLPPTTGNDRVEEPPVAKLSRSLQNNDGEVEMGFELLHPATLESTAKTISTKISKSKASVNGKRVDSAKSKSMIQYSKATKKAKEGKGQAAKVEREDIHSSKTHKTTVLQRKNPKLSARVVATLSSLPSRQDDGGTNPRSTPGIRVKSSDQANKGSEITNLEDGSIWDLDMKNSGDKKAEIPKQSMEAKAVKKKSAILSKESKASAKNAFTAKPATVPRQPKARRAAAVAAIKRIQGLEESDEIVDENEEVISKPKKQRETTTAKQNAKLAAPKTKGSEDSANHQKYVADDVVRDIHSHQAETPSNVPQEDVISEANNSEIVDLVVSTTGERTPESGPASESGLRKLNADLPPMSEVRLGGEEEEWPPDIDSQSKAVDELTRQCKIKDLTNLHVVDCSPVDNALVLMKEATMIGPAVEKDQGHGGIEMIGAAEDRHFQEAMQDDESSAQRDAVISSENTANAIGVNLIKQVKSAKEETRNGPVGNKVSRREKSSQAANHVSSRSVKNSQIVVNSKAQGPFEAKLSLLISDKEGTNPKAVPPARSPNAQRLKTTKESLPTRIERKGSNDVGTAEQANRAVTREYKNNHLAAGTVPAKANRGLIGKGQPERFQDDRELVHSTKPAHPGDDQIVGMADRPMTEFEIENMPFSSHIREISRRQRPLQPEQQRNKDSHPKKATIRLAIPRPGSAGRDKRKSVNDADATMKRCKLAPASEDQAPMHRKGERLQQARAKATTFIKQGLEKEAFSRTPVPDIKRKPEIISFSAEGPRNQGTASFKTPQPPKPWAALQAYTEQVTPVKGQDMLKRKAAPYPGDPKLFHHQQPAKRQRRDDVPPIKHRYAAQIIPQPNTMVFPEKSQRASSQSTRVDQNGSPMPSMRARNEKLIATQLDLDDDELPHISDKGIDDDDQRLVLDQGNYQWSDPTLPLTKIPLRPQGKKAAFEKLSSNNKRQPSSPEAPSSFASMTAHHVYHDGTIVNPQTKDDIIPTEPQDPFVGNGQMQKSDFIRALRMSSTSEACRKSDWKNQQAMSNFPKRRLPAHAEDPDKTLVEEEPPMKQQKGEAMLITSSSSKSTTSEIISSSLNLSSQGCGVDALAEWRKAFEPHQSSMLDVLLNISHVSI